MEVSRAEFARVSNGWLNLAGFEVRARPACLGSRACAGVLGSSTGSQKSHTIGREAEQDEAKSRAVAPQCEEVECC